MSSVPNHAWLFIFLSAQITRQILHIKLRNSCHFVLQRPMSLSQAHLFSFFAHSIYLWNVSSSFSSYLCFCLYLCTCPPVYIFNYVSNSSCVVILFNFFLVRYNVLNSIFCYYCILTSCKIIIENKHFYVTLPFMVQMSLIIYNSKRTLDAYNQP